MSLYKRDGSPNWWVEFEFNGQRVRKSARTANRRKAEEAERKFRRDMHDHHVLGKPVVRSMTLKQATKRYLETHVKPKGLKPRTAKAEAYALGALEDRFGADAPLSSLNGPAIARVKDKMLGEGLAAATVARYLATLKAILNKAHSEWGALAVVPKITLPTVNNGRMRWINVDEESRLLAACGRVPHLHDLAIFLIDTGARLAEATGLTWQDVDTERKPRGLVRFIDTKSGKPRSVPLTDRVQALLKRLHGEKPGDEEHVFLIRVNRDGRWKSEQKAKPFYNPHGSWKTAVKKADLEGLNLHDLRHTFASRLVMRGVPILSVSKLLGHASIQMTMRYAHLAPDEFDAAIGRLDQAAASPPQATTPADAA